MKEKILNHAGFPGPVKIEDMERTSMYRDYLAQITGTAINTTAADEEEEEEEEIPPKNSAGSKPGYRPYHHARLKQQPYGSTRIVK